MLLWFLEHQLEFNRKVKLTEMNYCRLLLKAVLKFKITDQHESAITQLLV